MLVTRRQATAIDAARRIRRNLVRMRGETDLGGDCGLASILLADAIHDVRSLRHTDDTYGSFCAPHVWNVVEGVILDVTATQFNDSSESDVAGEPPVFGVLVTLEPRVYHRPVSGRGVQTLRYLSDQSWRASADHRRIHAVMDRLRRYCRSLTLKQQPDRRINA